MHLNMHNEVIFAECCRACISHALKENSRGYMKIIRGGVLTDMKHSKGHAPSTRIWAGNVPEMNNRVQLWRSCLVTTGGGCEIYLFSRESSGNYVSCFSHHSHYVLRTVSAVRTLKSP